MAVFVAVLAVFGGVGLSLACESSLFWWLVTGDAPRPLRRAVERVAASLPHRRRACEPLPPVLLGLELRRLGSEYARIERDNQPHKPDRLAACAWAYDYVLLEYCRRLDLPVPSEHGPLTPLQRVNVEAELIGAGEEW